MPVRKEDGRRVEIEADIRLEANLNKVRTYPGRHPSVSDGSDDVC